MSEASQVLPFKARPSDTALMRDATILMLEDVIARVKAGEVRAAGVIMGLPDGGFSSDWRGWSGHLIASAAVMSTRLIEDARTE